MRRLLLTLLLLVGFALPSSFVFAVPAGAEEFTKAQIEQIIHDYIQNNPQVMIDSVQKFSDRQQDSENEATTLAIQKNREWLVNNANHAEAGNPKGDVTVVEFFDYNCGYCKAALGDLMTLLDSDKNLRLVFVEIPILGDSSIEAAKWALAAKKQKLYLEYHIGLMRYKGPLSEGVFEDQAKSAGLDVAKLKTDKMDPKLNDIIAENLNMARTLGIQGTPAFVIGDELIRGYVGHDGLVEAIAEARKNKAK